MYVITVTFLPFLDLLVFLCVEGFVVHTKQHAARHSPFREREKQGSPSFEHLHSTQVTRQHAHRDQIHQLLTAIPKGNQKTSAIGVGCKPDHDIFCHKKGKLKWAQRYMVVVKNRILIFRNKEKAVYPLQMMSLLEPSMTVQKSSQFDKAIEVSHLSLSLSHMDNANTTKTNTFSRIIACLPRAPFPFPIKR